MDPHQLLTLARRSPEFVGAHDLDGWRGLFAPGGRVEDPVGTPPCTKGSEEVDGLVRFWRTFIAPNRIWFEDRLDRVGKRSVARDVFIHMRMSTGLESVVPAYLLYEFEPTPEGPRIQRLAAHWEASRASKRMLAQGRLGKLTVLASTARIFRHLGLAGGRDYLRGTQGGVRQMGKDRALAFAEAWRARDVRALRALCPEIELDDERLDDVALERATRVAFTLEEPRASGPTVAARLARKDAPHGLGFFDFERGALKRARLYGIAG